MPIRTGLCILALAAVPPAVQQQMLDELRARLAERRAQRPARERR